jgi:ATP-dependent DNA ligase
VRGGFDGELVAFGNDRLSSFDRLRRRMLLRDASVPVALELFDVLEVDGEPRLQLPYIERREILESLALGFGRHATSRFDDGEALWKSVLAWA